MIDLQIISDVTCEDIQELNGDIKVSVQKEDIFSYGVFNLSIPPDKIGENDFEYRESKIPSLTKLYEDNIDISQNPPAIVCKMSGEGATNVSELVGVAIGLKATVSIFNIRKLDIVKIQECSSKEKRLDFISEENNIEIETKGTTSPYKINLMIADIHKKKENKDTSIQRIGFVTLLQKINPTEPSVIYVTDPEGSGIKSNLYGRRLFLFKYQAFLSFILDNIQYNKIVKYIKTGKNQKAALLPKNVFRYYFIYKEKKFLGQCFDKRLILSQIEKYAIKTNNINTLFNHLTKEFGVVKYFLGIDESLIGRINKNSSELQSYMIDEIAEQKNGTEYIQMQEGLLFIIARNRSLPEMESQYSDEKVKSKIKQVFHFIRAEPHTCGAPCRSREKKGKPCMIRTYRDSCHFHRR